MDEALREMGYHPRGTWVDVEEGNYIYITVPDSEVIAANKQLQSGIWEGWQKDYISCIALGSSYQRLGVSGGLVMINVHSEEDMITVIKAGQRLEHGRDFLNPGQRATLTGTLWNDLKKDWKNVRDLVAKAGPFAAGVIDGIGKGAWDAITGIPKLIHGSITDPVGTINGILTGITTLIRQVAKGQFDQVLKGKFPELWALAVDPGWDDLSAYKKGRYTGELIGKRGANILIGAGAAELLSLFKKVRKAPSGKSRPSGPARPIAKGGFHWQVLRRGHARACARLRRRGRCADASLTAEIGIGDWGPSGLALWSAWSVGSTWKNPRNGASNRLASTNMTLLASVTKSMTSVIRTSPTSIKTSVGTNLGPICGCPGLRRRVNLCACHARCRFASGNPGTNRWARRASSDHGFAVRTFGRLGNGASNVAVWQTTDPLALVLACRLLGAGYLVWRRCAESTWHS